MQSTFYERDWYALNEAVLRIESTDSIPLLQQVSLDCLRALIPCDQCVFFLSRTNNRRELCEPAVSGADAKFIKEFLEGAYDSEEDSELFFSGKHILSHGTETTRDSDLVPEEYLVSTKIYREMYSKQNIHYALRSSLMSRRRFVGTLELFNSKSRGDFTDKQLRTQKLIAPHIASHLALLLAFEEKTSSTPTVNQEEIKEAYHLTSREVEIVSMIATGLEDSEIIDILCISESTFKKHLYNAYRKMNVSSRSQLYNQLLKR